MRRTTWLWPTLALMLAAGPAPARPYLYLSGLTFGGQLGLHRSRVIGIDLGQRQWADTMDYFNIWAVPAKVAEVRWFPRGRFGFGGAVAEATFLADRPGNGLGFVSGGILGVNFHYITVPGRRSFQCLTLGTTWLPFVGLGANAEYSWVPLAPWPVELVGRLAAHADAFPQFWGVQASVGARVGLGWWLMRED